MNQSDNELVILTVTGDENAFNILYERYKDMIYNYLLYIESNRGIVEDLFQEIWVKVIRKLKDGQKIENFKGWIVKVASNYHKDYLRKKRLRNLIFRYQEDVSDTISDRDSHESSDLANSLEIAMSRLSPKQKELFYLKEIMGLPYGEIMPILGISETAAKSRMFKAVQKLREELKEYKEN